MAKASNKNGLILTLLILTGLVIGSFLGYLCRGISWLSWLDYGLQFGIGSTDGSGALLINLNVLIITFGISFKITIASIIGVVISLFVFSKL